MSRATVAVWAEGIRRGAHGESIIGDSAKGKELPWAWDSEDLQHFRRATRDHVLVMGRRTFDTLPDALKAPQSTYERPLVVLTHSIPLAPEPDVAGCWHAGTFETPEDLVRFVRAVYPHKAIAVIGGRETIEWMEPVLDTAYVTFVKGAHEGDVLAPFQGSKLGELFPRERFLGTTRAGAAIARYDREVPAAEEQELAA